MIYTEMMATLKPLKSCSCSCSWTSFADRSSRWLKSMIDGLGWSLLLDFNAGHSFARLNLAFPRTITSAIRGVREGWDWETERLSSSENSTAFRSVAKENFRSKLCNQRLKLKSNDNLSEPYVTRMQQFARFARPQNSLVGCLPKSAD